MKKLGQYLVDLRVITPDELDTAIEVQATYGARLGTNLVELGFLTIDQLGLHLSAVLGVPLPPNAWLESIDDRTANSLPRELIVEYGAFPIRVDRSVIHVVMQDPLDIRQTDEIAFISSRAVQPYIMPELRLCEWLERLYGVRRDARFANAGREKRTPRTQSTSRASSQAARPAPRSNPRGVVERSSKARAPGTYEELTDEQSFRDTYIDRDSRGQYSVVAGKPLEPSGLREPPGRPASREYAAPRERASSQAPAHDDQASAESHWAPPAVAARLPAQSHQAPPPAVAAQPPAQPSQGPTPALAAQPSLAPSAEARPPNPPALTKMWLSLERHLAEATSREDLVDSVLDCAKHFAEAVGLFVVHQGLVQGMRMAKGVAEARPIDGILLPSSMKSALTQPAQTGLVHRATREDLVEDRRFLQSMGRTDVAEVAVLPIKVKERVVNLLYVDNGQEPLSVVGVAALEALAGLAGAAYASLILRKKQQDDRAPEASTTGEERPPER